MAKDRHHHDKHDLDAEAAAILDAGLHAPSSVPANADEEAGPAHDEADTPSPADAVTAEAAAANDGATAAADAAGAADAAAGTEDQPEGDLGDGAEAAAAEEAAGAEETAAEETAAAEAPSGFDALPLSAPVRMALADLEHTEPTPIQAGLIPHLVEGRDVLGQAQTGTGKTAAFALPILSLLDPELKNPQALVLTPTRELAMQVAGAFEQYAAHMRGFKVLAIYGGSDYTHQFRRLNRGVHVAVGTPGRVMDHIRKGSLVLDDVVTVVLDEADEMLRMGFVEDVEWILQQTPPEKQVALFSATMPPAIRRLARTYLQDPAEVTIAARTTTVEATRQRYVLVDEARKTDALARVLEAEPTDGVIVFVRTKVQTNDIAEQLAARGFRAAALNGDMEQPQRERTVGRLRRGKLDILVATDVAARGLDIDRLSHVINFDIPNDPEAYVHRIGRTGRAGREGEAILLVTPEQRRLLRVIEHATKQRLERMDPPDADDINARRVARFGERITAARRDAERVGVFADIIHRYCAEHDVPELEVAAALASLAQGDEPLLLDDLPGVQWHRDEPRRGVGPRHARNQMDQGGRGPGGGRRQSPLEPGFERFRVSIGSAHGIKPGNLVGAIANEAGIQGRAIGRIDIHQEFSLIDLPEGMPEHMQRRLQQVRIFGVPLQLERFTGEAPAPAPNDRHRAFHGRRRELRHGGPRQGGPRKGGPRQGDRREGDHRDHRGPNDRPRRKRD
jgi:ATP-dependent RNA helicase DeaD